ncbi:MAG: glycoside hydrolase family 3 N-terminal domain-containing protein [Eubacteriales bacterium]|nr:glycoside hydrolase family 3 N-terminal domain-containing protein [Eubacteriales bacterium]
MEKYQDSTLSACARAKDLLGRMTLREKIGQLNQRLYGFRIYEKKEGADGIQIELDREFEEEVLKYGGLGCLYGLYRADPWADKDYHTGLTGALAKKAYNQVQRFVLEHSRLGIPMMMSSECPHGHQALDGYLLPVNLAAGATFHPQLLKDAYHVCGKQLQNMGVDFALASMLDVLRDPRWGRSEECYSEDPYLSARLAEAAVAGIQEAGPAVVAKHFAAQGEGTGGINASAARIGERELREIHLPPMAACAKAGVKGVMAAYNEIDGIYCHANPRLLKDILRDEMGFSGVVMADGVAIDQLDFMTGDNVASGALALSSGVDMGLWDAAFGKLEMALERGLVTQEQIDVAALRILTLKFERGLFEHPFLEETEEGMYFPYEKYPQSLQMARESGVLLKNREGVLPLTAQSGRLAVIGPNADALYNQLGDYSPPMRREDGCTVLDGIKQIFADWQVSYTQGCYLRGRAPEMLEEAKKLAEESDLIVCVLGTSSSRFGGAVFDANGAALNLNTESGLGMDCGEGMDCADLELPEAQTELLKTLAQTGKRIVTVVIAGRPLALRTVCELSDAVLLSFYPGPLGGLAIAELLAGRENPSGRLPVSLPAATGQVPVYYNYKSSYLAWNYMDAKKAPLFSFGFGLDYTRYTYENVALSAARLTTDELKENGISLRMKIRNAGGRAGFAVPQLYVKDVAASTVRRVKELKAFDKVWLEAGQEKDVCLALGEEQLGLWNERMQFVTEPGVFELELSDKGESIWKGEFELCI